jgi:hypothetical protein
LRQRVQSHQDCEDVLTLPVREFLETIFCQVGDSRVVEQTHKYVRHFLDVDTSSGLSARHSRFMAGVRSPVLRERCSGSSFSPVQLDPNDFAEEHKDCIHNHMVPKLSVFRRPRHATLMLSSLCVFLQCADMLFVLEGMFAPQS